MLLGGALYLRYMQNFRVAAAVGRYGSGKTLLACAVCSEFVNKGWVRHVACNFPTVWAQVKVAGTFTDLLHNPAMRDTFFIYDEGWLELGVGQSGNARKYLAYLRKYGSFLFTASVQDLCREVSRFGAERIFNGLSVGLPFWTYHFNLRGGNYKEKGRFHMMFPRQYFKLYDHRYIPEDQWFVGSVAAWRGLSHGK